jgi:hypothetical protein
MAVMDGLADVLRDERAFEIIGISLRTSAAANHLRHPTASPLRVLPATL